MNEKQRAKMREDIEKHGENLNRIFWTKLEDPVILCLKMRRLENKAHKLAERYCNGEIEIDLYEDCKERIMQEVDKILEYKMQYIPVFLPVVGVAGLLLIVFHHEPA